jgi:hypothetical protein
MRDDRKHWIETADTAAVWWARLSLAAVVLFVALVVAVVVQVVGMFP